MTINCLGMVTHIELRTFPGSVVVRAARKNCVSRGDGDRKSIKLGMRSPGTLTRNNK